jgi:hypothetical protein
MKAEDAVVLLVIGALPLYWLYLEHTEPKPETSNYQSPAAKTPIGYIIPGATGSWHRGG